MRITRVTLLLTLKNCGAVCFFLPEGKLSLGLNTQTCLAIVLHSTNQRGLERRFSCVAASHLCAKVRGMTSTVLAKKWQNQQHLLGEDTSPVSLFSCI